MKLGLWIILGIAVAGTLFSNFQHQQTGRIAERVAERASSESPVSSPKLHGLELLPQFKDYPAVVAPIPPRPIVGLDSHPDGQLYRTMLRTLASESVEYDFGGHYLVTRTGTGVPTTLVVDGLTGKIVTGPGSDFYGYAVRSDSRLFVAAPPGQECVKDSESMLCARDIPPRYYEWTGSEFRHICTAILVGDTFHCQPF